MNETEAPVILSGLGICLPEKVVSNDDLAQQIDTSDEWIRSRTGIGERRLAGEGQETSTMGAEAARNALKDAGLTVDDIDVIICTTMTPDMVFPSAACLIQAELGIPRVPAFDVTAACSGFLYGLEVGGSLVRTGAYKRALIVGSEKMSSVIDWEDRSTCVLFGDGAGACILEKGTESGVGIIDVVLGADGSRDDLLYMAAGGSRMPATGETVANRDHFLKMNGKEVFKLAVKEMGGVATELLERNGVTPDQLKCVIPHQANVRIIDSLAARLELPRERFLINIDRFGNTSAASVPLALEEARRLGRFESGDYILLAAFGAGLTWGGALLKWQ
ncbi:beta-ketoacyl-ACP synthase III [Rubellicoccus peritrichatus]|uniref:Beta-ketoacyl-[acyl-carrier-protein] synthase III n=1 Tax=Rubellicoccus peritrichatus TaxID=3080537 RepID=A0AAQ3L7I0_9BACT|nr:beta-ketoacyl-ACP synthase III [Puniceicoccus sp. CR14]WOO40685.1 beta-ketoacyl-ACP synthase III [Puniceicoccus sp. CR14]